MSTNAPTFMDRFNTALLKVLPQHGLSALMHRLARSEITWLKNMIIKFVVKNFNVDMKLAIEENPLAYASFNKFFTRQLKPEVRPIGTECLASPVDGKVSQCGAIKVDRLIQGENSEACDNLLNHYIEVSNRLAAYPKLQAQLLTILVATKENSSLNWQNIDWAHHIAIEEQQRDALFNQLKLNPIGDRWCSPAQSTAALFTPNGLHIANLPLDSATDIAESLRMISESYH